MLIALLIAGIVFLLAGLLGIAFGIPIKEFSFGNTEILAGVMTACAGMIMLRFGLPSASSSGRCSRLEPALGLASPPRRRGRFPATCREPRAARACVRP